MALFPASAGADPVPSGLRTSRTWTFG